MNASIASSQRAGLPIRIALATVSGFGTGLPLTSGAAPLVRGAPVEQPETVASAIRIGNPARWEEAMGAMAASHGAIRAVSDAEILDAYRFLAAHEGVFCEPASAAGVAGLLRHGAEDARRVACVLTGHGLKDPQTALAHAGSVVPCEPELAAVEHAVLG